MDSGKTHRRLARGAVRWHASRLKPVVKRLGVKNKKKPSTRKTTAPRKKPAA